MKNVIDFIAWRNYNSGEKLFFLKTSKRPIILLSNFMKGWSVLIFFIDN